jgi:hypothetical protein
MPRQIEDDEYNFLQQRRQVADFVESIYNDPQLSKEAKALIKKKYPTLQIPDYDIETKVDQRFKERDDREREAAETARRQADDEAYKSKRKKTQDEYGFTDDAMKELEDFMIERNIGDYEVAATYKAAKSPKTTDPTQAYDDQRWNHAQRDGFAEVAKDPEGWARKEILGAIFRDEQKAKQQGF